MLALDVARVEAGLLLIDVDFHSSKKALIESQKYSPFEMGLGRLVQLDTRPFVGRAALRRGAAPRAGRGRSSASRSAGRRSRSCTTTLGLRAADRRRRVARRRAGLQGRPPGRPRDDDDVVAGAEEADRARDGRRAALRRGTALECRGHRRSGPPPRPGHGRQDAVLQPAAQNRRRSNVTNMASGSKDRRPGAGSESAERELCAPHAGLSGGPDRGVRRACTRRWRAGFAAICCRSAATPTLADDLLAGHLHADSPLAPDLQPGRPVTPWVFAIARHVYLMKRRSAGAPAAVRGDGWPPTRRSDDAAHDARGARRRRTQCAARCATCRPISGRRC